MASEQDIHQAQACLDQLAGKPLIQYCVGAGVRLDFAVPTHPELTIEAPITIERSGDVQVGEPQSELVMLTLLGLLHHAAEPTVASSGHLTLRFAEGTTLTVLPEDNYEAWQLRDDDGLLIVCMPGEDLAIWLPTR